GLVISWLGHTEVTAVSLTLPLADAPFAQIDKLRAEHDWLPLLPITRGVQEILVRGVVVELREGESGGWNVQRLGTGGDEPAGPRSAPGPIHDLPALRIEGLSVDLIRPEIEPQRISNIAVSTQPRGTFSHDLLATIDDLVRVEGVFSSTGGLPHQLAFTIAPSPRWSLLGGADVPERLHVAGDWAGELPAEGPRGLLNLRRGEVDPVRVTGRARVTAGGAALVRLEPRGLRLAIHDMNQPPLQLVSGEMTVT